MFDLEMAGVYKHCGLWTGTPRCSGRVGAPLAVSLLIAILGNVASLPTVEIFYLWYHRRSEISGNTGMITLSTISLMIA